MSVTNSTNPDCMFRMHFRPGSGRCGGHWSGANIAAMVLGFVLCPPLGILVLIWAITGHRIQDLPAWLHDKWAQIFRGGFARAHEQSDNVVFNEYQQTQYDRIVEIKEEIKSRAEAFRAFRSDAKRRKDQREFEDFMASSPEKGRGES